MFNYNITDDLGAEQALVNLKNFKEEKERLIDLCNKQIEVYKEKIEMYQADIEDVERELKQVLKNYMATVEAKETKTQFSYQLPSGKLIFKKEKNDFVKCDETLLNTVDEKYIKIKKSIDWAELKKTLEVSNGVAINKETGEIVEGVNVVEVAGEFKLQL